MGPSAPLAPKPCESAGLGGHLSGSRLSPERPERTL
jgi:hypothetical protein